MKVSLVSCSKSNIDEIEGLTELVAYCALVSNPSNQMNNDTSEKLIKYLINNSHWSPLEMVHVTLEIETTRDIARQILRHRSFSFQEFSQRYADPTQMGFDFKETRLQDTKNRQNSTELDLTSPDDRNLNNMWIDKQKRIIREAKDVYSWAIKNGIAKEQARAVLPEGLTVSKMYMAGTLRSWIHYCQLRSENGTQKEHMEIARECARAIAQIFPISQQIIKE